MRERRLQIVFALLVLGAGCLGLWVARLRHRTARREPVAVEDAPMVPAGGAETPVRLVLANDASGTLETEERRLAVSDDAAERARQVLHAVAASYARPESPHRLEASSDVEAVFLVAEPGAAPPKGDGGAGLVAASLAAGSAAGSATGPTLAVVDLSKAFADAHPSGLQNEWLTVASLAATLRENVPGVRRVQFLVDGRPRATLAGHVDLSRPVELDAIEAADRP